MKYQCMTCPDLNFPSLEALEEHEKAGHPQPIKPEEEFNKTLAEIEEDKKKKAIEQSQLDALRKKSQPIPAAISKPQPLQLKYQFIGQDKEGHEVKTITVDTEAGYFVNAFCLICDEQIESLKVAKLPEPKVVLEPVAITTADSEIVAQWQDPKKITNDTKKNDNKVPPKV